MCENCKRLESDAAALRKLLFNKHELHCNICDDFGPCYASDCPVAAKVGTNSGHRLLDRLAAMEGLREALRHIASEKAMEPAAAATAQAALAACPLAEGKS